jgi:hypothetical protein
VGDDLSMWDSIEAGLRAAGRDRAGFTVATFVPALVADDAAAARSRLRQHIAFYVGAMGRFYHEVVSRQGHAEAADRRLAAGAPARLLEGVPFLVKDVIPTRGVLAALEHELGKPVVSAIQASFSPNNPSGVIYPASAFVKIEALLGRAARPIVLISDEPYRRIIFDGLTYPQVFPCYQNTIVVHSHAKDLALPGERIGYIAVNPAYPEKRVLVDGLTFCNRTLGFVNAPALMQHVVRVLQGVSVDVADYQRKRDYLYAQLGELGYSVVKPQGAFYLFPRSPIDDDVAFVEALQQWNVLTVPGRGFGTPGHFRIAYCVEDRVLEGAMEGFARAAEQFGL